MTTQQPTILGQLTEEENQTLTTLRGRTDQVVYNIGQVALQQHRLMANIDAMEAQARGVLQDAGKRLGIPDGVPWSVTNEGFAIQAATPTQQVTVPTPAEDEPKTPKE